MVASPKSPAQNWSPRHCRDLRWHPTARPRHSKPQATPQSDLELEQVFKWWMFSGTLVPLQAIFFGYLILRPEILTPTRDAKSNPQKSVCLNRSSGIRINWLHSTAWKTSPSFQSSCCLPHDLYDPPKKKDRSWLNPTKTMMICVSISFLGVAMCIYICIYMYIYIYIYIYMYIHTYILIRVFCDCPQPSRHWTLPLGCPHACHSAWQMPDKTAVKQRWRKVPPVSAVFNCWALLSIEDLNFHELFDFCHVVRKVFVASWLEI